MQIIRSPADADAADPELRQLLIDTFARVADCPEVLGFVLVVEPGDTIASINAILRFSILTGRHEFIVEHAGYYELLFLIDDSGYGVEVLVPNSIDLPDLLAMCCLYAVPATVP